MMPTLFVLDVPEFATIVTAARHTPGVSVSQQGSYWRISAPGELRFSRRGLRMKPAVWWGMFTGGLDGKIEEMTANYVRVVEG